MKKLTIYSKKHGKRLDNKDHKLIKKYHWTIQKKYHLFYAAAVINGEKCLFQQYY